MKKPTFYYRGITISSDIQSVCFRIGSDGNIYAEDQENNADGSIIWPEPTTKKVKKTVKTIRSSKEGSVASFVRSNFSKKGTVKEMVGNQKTIWGAFNNNGWKVSIRRGKSSGIWEVKRVA
jgi:hypothetical protein